LVTSPPLAEAVANSRQADQPKANPRLNKALHIYCSITKKSAVEDGYPIGPQVERAKNCLFEYGMVLSVEFVAASGPRFADQINFPSTLVLDDSCGARRGRQTRRRAAQRLLQTRFGRAGPRRQDVAEADRAVTLSKSFFAV
jgi:hypothetical protein